MSPYFVTQQKSSGDTERSEVILEPWLHPLGAVNLTAESQLYQNSLDPNVTSRTFLSEFMRDSQPNSWKRSPTVSPRHNPLLSFPLLTVCQPLSTSFLHESLFFLSFNLSILCYFSCSHSCKFTPEKKGKKKLPHT